MNERIKELILMAGWKNSYNDPTAGFEPEFEGEDINLDCIEKFAELIVNECAKFSDAYLTEREGDTFWMGKAITAHFGVEK